MANTKKILVVQPPGLSRESILILLHAHRPDIANTPQDAYKLLQAACTARHGYEAIFLGGFPLPEL